MSGQATRYDVRNAQGELIAVHVRRDHDDGTKTFAWERPGGSSGLDGLPSRQLPLYGSEDVALWRAEAEIILVEGEKARDALARHGFHALATVTGATTCPDRKVLAVLQGHPVVLWPDNDDVGRHHMSVLARHLPGIAAVVRRFDWAGAPGHGDAADYLADGSGAAERLRVEIASAPPVAEFKSDREAQVSVSDLVIAAFEKVAKDSRSDDQIAALRKLRDSLRGRDGLELVAARREASEHLKSFGLTDKDARDLVREALPATKEPSSSQKLQGTALDLSDPIPWPEPVDGGLLADEVVAVLRRFLVMPPESARAVVLWIFFTYLLDVVDVAPRLLMTSPTKACGKTRCLILLRAMVRRAVSGSSITPAALFRLIETHAPTLLLDELDNLGLNEKGDLLAVLNSGHTRGTASAIRTVGEEYEVHTFSTWCGMALAGIRSGNLPDTVASRAIRILLIRKRKTDKVERLRETKLCRELEPVRRKLMRWSADHGPEIGAADPAIPEELDGRAADNWSVLVAIADALGGEWPTHARGAARVLEAIGSSPDSIGELLLTDLHELFEQRACDRLSSEGIAAALGELEGRPWAEWGKQRKPLSKNQLARLLKEFEIQSGSIRLGDGSTAKGYYRESFVEAWERYLPAMITSEPSQRHNAGMTRVELDFGSVTDGLSVTDRNSTGAAPGAACDGVTVQTPLVEGGERRQPSYTAAATESTEEDVW